jgi:hypothetical protein
MAMSGVGRVVMLEGKWASTLMMRVPSRREEKITNTRTRIKEDTNHILEKVLHMMITIRVVVMALVVLPG